MADRGEAGLRVAFVGAGPGDPRLLTLAATDALRAADVVLADSDDLVTLALDERVRVKATVQVATGRSPAERLDEARELAASGRRVARLFRGDPFLDGSAAAEAAAALAAGVEIDVVPGVSWLTAAPEFAGAQLDRAPIAFVEVASRPITSVWAPGNTTIVTTRASLVGAVAAHAQLQGHATSESVIATLHAGTTSQQTVMAPIGSIAGALSSAESGDQVTLVFGPAAQHDPAAWFESKPMFGWRVLVPRTKAQSASLISRLHDHGAQPEEVPTIAVEPPRQPQLLDKAIRGLVEGSYEWVVFSSVNAVRAVRDKVEEYGLDARVFSGVRVAVVGNTTAHSLLEWGIRPDLMPEGEHSAAGLAGEFPAHDDLLDPINRVFLPRADIAVDTLVTGLTELGWEVEDVTAYRTVRALPPPAETREAIKTGDFDAVIFTSSSTVRNLVGIAGKPHACTIIAAIGPATAATCREHGLRVDVLASEPDVLLLADELADFAARRRAQFIAAGKPVKKPSQRRRRRKSVPTD